MPPIHNALKYGTALLRGFSRALGLGEDEEGVVRLGETLTPVIDFWSATEPQWAVLRGERLGVTRHFKAAVAGEFGVVALVNPGPPQRRVVVVEFAACITGVAGGVILEGATAAQVNALTGAAQQVGSSRDRRFGEDTTTQTIAGSAVAQTTGGRLIDTALSTAAGTPGPFTVALPYVLPPGQALAIVGRIANESVVGFFRYREREAFPGEV